MRTRTVRAALGRCVDLQWRVWFVVGLCYWEVGYCIMARSGALLVLFSLHETHYYLYTVVLCLTDSTGTVFTVRVQRSLLLLYCCTYDNEYK